jgi:hypothetical protein
MKRRIRVSLWMGLVLVAAAAFVLAILSEPVHEAWRMQGRRLGAARLASHVLGAQGWPVAASGLVAVPLRDGAFLVEVVRPRGAPGVRRPGPVPADAPQAVIIPADPREPLILLLPHRGPLSRAASRLLVDRDQPKVATLYRAE